MATLSDAQAKARSLSRGLSYWRRKSKKSFPLELNEIIMLLVRIELTTSPLPRGCFYAKAAQSRHLVWG
jgi:hypothetical protein